MGLKQISEVVVIGPASKKEDLLRELARFEDFHVEEDRREGGLYERAQALERRISRVISSLGLEPQPGVIEVLLKGYNVSRMEFRVKGWGGLLKRLEEDAVPLLEVAERLLNEVETGTRRLEELDLQSRYLELLAGFDIDVQELRKSERFYIELVTIKVRDLKEFQRSLPGSYLYEERLSEKDLLLLIIDKKEREGFIERILKSFEAKRVEIPEGLPRSPRKAYQLVIKELRKEAEKLKRATDELLKLKEEKGEELLGYWEASMMAEEAFSKDVREGRFLVLRGFVPKDKLTDLEKRLKGFATVVTDGDLRDKPTIMKNNEFSKSFETVTLAQGPPSHHEVDPTPIISFVFPVFYGLMFADAGQGLLLLLLGLYMRYRAGGQLKKWGTLIASFGFVATFVGLAVGEIFGFSTGHLPVIGEFLEHFRLLEVKEFSSEVVGELLTIGILIGVFHITSGLILDIYQAVKENAKLELIAEKVPGLMLYVGGLLFAFAFIGGGFSFSELFSEATAPIIGLPCYVLTYVSLPVIAVATLLLIFGKPAFGKLFHHAHHEGIGILVIEGVVEFLLRIVEYMANTISYARLGILLMVHVALMMVVNFSLGAGIIGLPLVILGNIGVMMLEGLIVYIQALRLHIYEWFTKFYKGEGRLFKRFIPETVRAVIRWE